MIRTLALAVTVGLMVALVAPSAPSAHTDPGLTYLCSPPLPRTQDNCNGWHNVPVTVVWSWNIGVADAAPGQCGKQVFDKDSDGTTPLGSCTVVDVNDSTTTTVGVALKIDRTPPSITAATPSRAPDVNGWWNQPVSFLFSGGDALSGIASCDNVTYRGPGGNGAQVVGGCHDGAGNYGVRGFPINFDSTAPALERVKATPESRSAALAWDASPDTVRTQVMRAPGRRGRGRVMVYSGNAERFTDTGIANGTKYTYTVTAFDGAGNATSRTVHATPRLSLGLAPRRGARLRRPPLLRWPTVKGAAYYNLQLFRGNLKVLTAWPSRAHLKLHRHGRYHGLRYRLGPGHYRWYVWPGYGSRAERRYGAFLGQSSFVIVR